MNPVPSFFTYIEVFIEKQLGYKKLSDVDFNCLVLLARFFVWEISARVSISVAHNNYNYIFMYLKDYDTI
jgi:hypothetical protein